MKLLILLVHIVSILCTCGCASKDMLGTCGTSSSELGVVTPPYVPPELVEYQVLCSNNKKANISKLNLLNDDSIIKGSFVITQNDVGLVYAVEVEYSCGDYSILVLDSDGAQIQKITGSSAISNVVDFVDFNFDGYIDLQINLSGTQNEPHLIYLWDAELNIFYELICGEMLCYYEASEDYVMNWIKDGSSCMIVQKLIWCENDELALESEEEINLTE